MGRPVSGLVWLFTCGLFGLGWVVDFFLLKDFVEGMYSYIRMYSYIPQDRGVLAR